MKILRKIVKFDEDKCDGCGLCIPSCAEGAIKIVEGKARLIGDKYCDGLGACLGECPQGAISVEEREGEAFDEKAVEKHLEETRASESLPCGCQSTVVQSFDVCHESGKAASCNSRLAHWPVQLALVPPNAPFLKGAHLLLTAHCAPFAYAGFHDDFIKDHALVCACPKLDDFKAHQAKLTELLRQSDVKSLTVVLMEVPCCGGLTFMAKQAISASGKDIPLKVVTIGVKGDVLCDCGVIAGTDS